MRPLFFLGMLLLTTVTFMGCGARTEVAKDKILAKLDSVLGELDVKRKSIELKQKELRGQLDDLRVRRIEAGVRLERLQEKKTAAEATMEGLKGKLSRVRDLVEEAKSAGGTLERNGETFTAEDIKEAADDQISKFNKEKIKLDGLVTSISALQGSFDFLDRQEKTAKDLMDRLEVKIGEIDAKKVAVDAVKEATSISGDSQSINDSIAQLEKDIDGLAIDVETALRVEEDKLADLDSATSKADKLLTESPSLEGISDSLDKILGDGGE